MERSICTYALIPVRATPAESAEMVTQILFGEKYSVLDRQGKWARVRTEADNYDGWIDAKLVADVSEEEIERQAADAAYVTRQPFSRIESMDGGNALPALAPMGSVVYNGMRMATLLGGEDMLCTLNGRKFILHETGERQDGMPLSPVGCAKRLLGAPYLWGGRTAFGIDCSGLVQLAYKCCGIQLPRDASQMVESGSAVPFGAHRENDVAFFANDNGRICHVGLCMEGGQIIHASGSVRIDTLDGQGILNMDRGGVHTHKLASIKRLWAN